MANYMIDADYDINKEKKEIMEILDRTEKISDLPKSLSQRCLKFFNFVVFSMLMPQSHEDKHLREDNEFISFLLIKIKRFVDYSTGTLYITFVDNEYMIGFNPYFLFRFDILQMVNLIKHELYHMIWQHPIRGKQFLNNFTHDEINIAMDCCINQYLPYLPNGCVTLDRFKEVFKPKDGNTSYVPSSGSVEDYLEVISKSSAHEENKKIREMIKDLVKDLMSSGNGFPSQDDDDKINKTGKNKEEIEISIDASGDGESDNKINKGNLKGLNHDWLDELNEQDSKLAKEVLRSLVNDARNNMRGTIPSYIMSLIEELNTVPELEWQDYLRRYAGSVPVPYKKSIMRNDRRQPNRIELKGRLSDHEVRIVCAVDTSGSVSDDMIRDFMSEVFFITKGLKKKMITLIQCDAEIQSVDEIKKPNDIKLLKRNGCGGTAFSPVFEYLRDNDMKNDILIYFTDGCGEKELSCKPKHYKTIWVLYDDYRPNKQLKISLDEPYGVIRYFDENNLRGKG